MKITDTNLLSSIGSPQLKNEVQIKNSEFQSKIKASDPKTIESIKKAEESVRVAKEFETLFLDMMLKTMRQTAKPEEESNATGIYQGMLDGEYTKSMAEGQDFGIQQMLLRWMKENDTQVADGLKAKQALDAYKNTSNIDKFKF